MKKLNIVLLYNKEETKILMCKREKEPYKGKYNLVGGKIEPNEDELQAAYRELEEETGITANDVKLSYLMDFEYKMQSMKLEVFAGKLNKPVDLVEEVNKLYWIDKSEDFFDTDKFAGDGNLWHIVKHAENYKNEIFK